MICSEYLCLSFQELFELAQRKLLRQLTIYAENQDTDIYPRLFLVDFVKEQISDSDVSDTELTAGTVRCYDPLCHIHVVGTC